MRELEKKALLLAKKTDSDMARMGRDDALRELAAEKVRVCFLLLLRSKRNATLFFRFQKLIPKTTAISNLRKEKIEKFGV